MTRACFIVVAVILFITVIPARADDDLANELPRIKPLDASAALKSFKLHAGFRLEPSAVEPLVTDPVAACYDADGRLYVAEMRGYPYPENSPTGYVRRLEDSDGDGRFDRSTLFVEGLSWPTGVVPYDGGVFIAVAPDLLYAKDTDGDGKADIKKVMFSGFGLQNVQALLNGLLWGPDGWIYGVSGGNGGDIKNLSRPNAKPVSVRGRDFRFKPDGSAFEAISGGGQFGHSFDDWGHRFTCNNSNHIRQIVLPASEIERNPALVVGAVVDDIAAEGPAGPVYRISAAEPWRIVRTRQRAADPEYRKKLPPTELVATGFFTSATGVTIYRGDAFPEEYRGNAFIGDVGGNLVHRKTLTRNGAEFLATRADQNVEFLASTDNWFRPVNFTNTPDGTLLILDMYRETIEHPFSIPEPIKKHLDLTSGKDLGRLYNLVPESGYRKRHPALSDTKTVSLVDFLADPNAWWRETAQRLLIERKDSAAFTPLHAMALNRPNALARVHALWTLDVLGDLNENDLLPAFSDPEPGVREQAARLSSGRLGTGSRLIEPLYALADDPNTMVRFQTAFALGNARNAGLFDALAKIVVRDPGDRWIRAAVLSSVSGHPDVLIEKLAVKGFFNTPEGLPWFVELATLVGTENKAGAIKTLLDFASGDETLPALTRGAFLGLGRGLQRSGSSLRSVMNSPEAKKKLGPIFIKAAAVAAGNGPIAARVDAIRLFGLGPVDPILDFLPAFLEATEPTSVQLAALQTLNEIADPKVPVVILDHWKSLTPPIRREAIEAIFSRAERLETLLDAIEAKVVVPSELDPGRQKQLLNAKNEVVRKRAKNIFVESVRADLGEVITRYRKALAREGDREKGKALFVKTCATCHRAENQGIDVGPNLATVSGRTPEDLLIHILDPNREVNPIYVNYTLETSDGRILTGMIAEESANVVTLKRAEGASDTVHRARIESIASTGQSLMPEGLEKSLDPQNIADVIAYLRSIPPAGR